MPSVSASNWKPASASSSVAEWYSARPVAASAGVLRADAGVVEARADRVRLEDLAVLVLEEERARAVQHTRDAPAHRRAVLAALESEAAGLDADEPRVAVEVSRERPHRVRSAADAGHHDVGIGAVEERAALAAGLVADDPLEFPHHPRVRMRADDRPDAVVRRLDRRDPVAQRLVDRVLERRAARLDRDDLGAEQLHPPYVERLAFDVDRAHEDGAVEAEQCGRGRGRHTVLACARLRDHPLLVHPARQQGLAEHVVDLVRAGVRQVLPFDEQPHAETLREPVAFRHRRRPARVAPEQPGELGPELLGGPRRAELALELLQRRDERLGNEPSTEVAVEAAASRRLGAGGIELDGRAANGHGHGRLRDGKSP